MEESFFDEYDFGQLLGSGSFGQVRACWRMGEQDFGRLALKVVDSEGEAFEHTAGFLSAQREADVLQLVRHPHIVELIDVFEEDSWILLILERVNGGELFSAICNPMISSFTEATAGLVGFQLLSALEHMHSRRAMHRDVKAENVLLSSDPLRSGSWHVKLVDFGLATRLDREPKSRAGKEVAEGLICGTAYYCAPEVWMHDQGPKADVWAAGVLIYLALHGTFPFLDRDPEVVERLIRDPAQEPPFAPACARECPGYEVTQEARRCLSTMLAKDVAGRPSARKAIAEQTWLRPPGVFRDSVDQCVPMPVRLRAGRAAARPQVSAPLESNRTQALLSLKARHVGLRSRDPAEKFIAGPACWMAPVLNEETAEPEMMPACVASRQVARGGC